MEGKDKKCIAHKSALVGLCIDKNCKINRLVCCKCINFGHKNCRDNTVFFEDLEESNLVSILSLPIFDNIFKVEEVEHATSLLDNSEFMKQVSHLFSDFLDKLTNMVSQYESVVLDKMEEVTAIKGFEERIKQITNFEELMHFYSSQSVEDMAKTAEELDIIKNRPEVLKGLRLYRNEIKDSLKFMSVITNLKSLIEEITSGVERRLSIESVMKSTDIRFDSSMTNQYHQMSEDMRKVTHINLNSTHSATFLNFEMSPDSGIYTWKLKFEGLAEHLNIPRTYWGSMGIVEYEKWGLGRENFSYSSPISYCTDNTHYGGTTTSFNSMVNLLEGKVITLTYDTSSCVLTITHEDKMLITGKGKPGVSYKPIIMTYKIGNSCTLVD